MKTIKKLVEKWEKEKKTPKTEAYYKKLLSSFDLETIKKLRKIIDILDEEIKLDVSCGKYEPPYTIGIKTNKFEKANLLLSDVKKILNLFSDSKYLLIPPPPDNQNQKEIIIYSPTNDFSTALQDWCYKYPYEENFTNFKKALYQITAQESSIEVEELNLEKLDFHKALFLLRTLYRKMLNILEAFCGRGYFNVRDGVINFYYVSFKETINQILEMKGFEDLKKEVPELFDSLIGDIEEADMEWEYGYSQMAYKFLGEIENLYIKSGTKSFKLPQVLENKLKETDKAIAAHIEYDKKLWGRTEKSLDKVKKDFDWGDSSKKVNQIDAKARAEEIRKLFGEEKRIEEIAKRVIEKSQKEPIGERGDTPDVKPYTFVKKSKGYFKFYKEGENIKIGKTSSRHFKLMQCLCEPHFGIQKTIEAIFEAIKLPKDKSDSDLESWSPQRRTKMLILIEYAKKELQKNKKLQGKIKYKLDNRKNNMWLELEG